MDSKEGCGQGLTSEGQATEAPICRGGRREKKKGWVIHKLVYICPECEPETWKAYKMAKVGAAAVNALTLGVRDSPTMQ